MLTWNAQYAYSPLTLEVAFCWSSLCLFMYLPVTDMFT